ncbi:hypothetical protein D3C77_616960 [compost metagenome]
MVVISAQLAQIEVKRHLRITRGQLVGNTDQRLQRLTNLGRRLRQRGLRLIERLTTAAQPRQRAQHAGQRRLQSRGQALDLVHRLALQRIEQPLLSLAHQPSRASKAAVDAHMPEVHVHIRHIGKLEHFQHQADHLDVARRTAVAIQLSTQLDRATRRRQRLWLGV